MADNQAPTAKLLEFPENAVAAPSIGLTPVVGTLVGQRDEQLLVDFPDNPTGEAVPARSTVALDPATVAAALADGQGVLLVFEGGRADAPIIIGLLQPPVPLVPEVAPDGEGDGESVVAHVDGERVEIEGKDEIVLRCGKASITLRRNGRVVIRGAYVETRSSGVNRVKGGSVEIN
ncbi:MAG: hypothetical protein KC457_07710 [Myxococcales bacterium]|nr:hypothetical protein [Myxococcales bacterium]